MIFLVSFLARLPTGQSKSYRKPRETITYGWTATTKPEIITIFYTCIGYIGSIGYSSVWII